MPHPKPLRYVPYEELGETPSIIVDGPPHPHSRLTLSHWPKSGTPKELKADTSAQIVFRYLERPDIREDVEVVSNNHFDEDGLVSIYTMTDPTNALRRREILLDVAAAGDFGTYRHRDAARITFVLSAFADPDRSLLPKTLFERPYPQMTASLYQELLPRFPEITAAIDSFRELWVEEDARLAASEAALEKGSITIEELPSLDLAIVNLPESLPEEPVHRFTQKRTAACHPMAIHNATGCFRILLIRGRSYQLRYRYETWVQYVSRRPLPRVDLGPLADQLSEREPDGVRWQFDGVDEITPELQLMGAEESRVDPESFRRCLLEFLGTSDSAWDPYDP